MVNKSKHVLTKVLDWNTLIYVKINVHIAIFFESMCLYICVEDLEFSYSERGRMYSPEFMRYLINYQKPEYNENIHKTVKNFRFGFMNRLASVLLLSKR